MLRRAKKIYAIICSLPARLDQLARGLAELLKRGPDADERRVLETSKQALARIGFDNLREHSPLFTMEPGSERTAKLAVVNAAMKIITGEIQYLAHLQVNETINNPEHWMQYLFSRSTLNGIDRVSVHLQALAGEYESIVMQEKYKNDNVFMTATNDRILELLEVKNNTGPGTAVS